MRSRDGGLSWKYQDSGTTKDLNDVFFSSIRTGVIVGNKATFISTIDSGIRWTPGTVGDNSIADLDFFGVDHFSPTNISKMQCTYLVRIKKCTYFGTYFGTYMERILDIPNLVRILVHSGTYTLVRIGAYIFSGTYWYILVHILSLHIGTYLYILHILYVLVHIVLGMYWYIVVHIEYCVHSGTYNRKDQFTQYVPIRVDIIIRTKYVLWHISNIRANTCQNTY